MPDALARKHHRQQALVRLVGRQRLSTQRDLARALRAAGFRATQATISRDIEELGLIKVARDGAHAYAAPLAIPASGGIERLRRFCEDYPVEAASAGNLVVLRSLPGTANTLAVAMDAAALEGVVGTLAGDDTVFVAARSEGAGRRLMKRLGTYGVRSSGSESEAEAR